MSRYEELEDKIYDINSNDEAFQLANEIKDAYEKEDITEEEKDHLLSEIEDERLAFPSIDDDDWELMKEFDPNLSDQ